MNNRQSTGVAMNGGVYGWDAEGSYKSASMGKVDAV